MRNVILVCKDCEEWLLTDQPEAVDITISSADCEFCEACGHYRSRTRAFTTEEFEVEMEACDCEEKYGRIQHHNGGHYHYGSGVCRPIYQP